MFLEVFGFIHQPHTFAAATSNGLDQDGITDLGGLLGQSGIVLCLTVVARHNWDACVLHQGLGRVFEAHCADRISGRSDKDKACLCDRLNKLGVFGQKPITGMDCLCACIKGCLNNQVRAKVAIGYRGWPKAHGLIRHLNMQCVCIRVRVDSNCLHAQRFGSAHNPARDLAPIGDQYFVKHGSIPCHHAAPSLAHQLIRCPPR